MPETEDLFDDSFDGAAVMRDFYAAVGASDAVAIGALVEANFAPDCTLSWPESLPYGGSLVGASRIARALSRTAPGGPTSLRLVNVIGDGSRIAAEIEFDWSADASAPKVATSAVEVWSFSAGGLVTGIRAYYWDTHALLRTAP